MRCGEVVSVRSCLIQQLSDGTHVAAEDPQRETNTDSKTQAPRQPFLQVVASGKLLSTSEPLELVRCLHHRSKCHARTIELCLTAPSTDPEASTAIQVLGFEGCRLRGL